MNGWMTMVGNGKVFRREVCKKRTPKGMCGGKDRTLERECNSCVIWGKSYSIFFFCKMKLTENICKSMMSHKTKKRSSGQQKRSANHHVGWWNIGKAKGNHPFSAFGASVLTTERSWGSPVPWDWELKRQQDLIPGFNKGPWTPGQSKIPTVL